MVYRLDMSKNIKEIQIDKQLESMSKSLKQLSSNVYADNFDLSSSLFSLSSFVHKMLVAYNQGAAEDQQVINMELLKCYNTIKELIGAPQ